jgi:hypothetical protein
MQASIMCAQIALHSHFSINASVPLGTIYTGGASRIEKHGQHGGITTSRNRSAQISLHPMRTYIARASSRRWYATYCCMPRCHTQHRNVYSTLLPSVYQKTRALNWRSVCIAQTWRHHTWYDNCSAPRQTRTVHVIYAPDRTRKSFMLASHSVCAVSAAKYTWYTFTDRMPPKRQQQPCRMHRTPSGTRKSYMLASHSVYSMRPHQIDTSAQIPPHSVTERVAFCNFWVTEKSKIRLDYRLYS